MSEQIRLLPHPEAAEDRNEFREHEKYTPLLYLRDNLLHR